MAVKTKSVKQLTNELKLKKDKAKKLDKELRTVNADVKSVTRALDAAKKKEAAEKDRIAKAKAKAKAKSKPKSKKKK